MMFIRPAILDDCPVLTRIVRTSSAYPGQYRTMVETIEIDQSMLERESFFIIETDGNIAGFYALLTKADCAELDFMFVDNAYQNQGIGRILFHHMLQTAGEMGYSTVEIIAHPPAEAFYAKMGAVTQGMIPPKGRATWSRPHMWIKVQDK